MINYNPDDFLISFHIPKTAGTSLKLILKSWFGKKLKLHYYDNIKKRPPQNYFESTEDEENEKSGICIHGHFAEKRNIGVLDYYPNARQFMMFLRDPFDMHVSNYFYLKAKGARADGKKLKMHLQSDYTIRDYFYHVPRSFMLDFLPSQIQPSQLMRFIEERFIFVGIQEEFNKSIEILAHILGFKVLQQPEVNKSKYFEQIPYELKERFVENNPIEYKIYDIGKTFISSF